MILLSFDIEEFDMAFEYVRDISFEDQISISITGTHLILDLLKKHNFKATFFSTATFALNAPAIIARIKNEGHELASHSYYHSKFEVKDLLNAKEKLEKLFGSTIYGFRMPRMMPVDELEIEKAGYLYNSSINPTWLPGRYNNLHIKRTYFKQGNVLQLPASVSTFFRIPLFWLSFHNFPVWLYRLLVKKAIKRDKYLNVYFHPWEFTDLSDQKRFGFPGYVSKNSGLQMVNRMDNFLAWLNKQNYKNSTIYDFVKPII
jgi:peptidoglycan/xylan/chitin deacetylase (PgdA/CDA1 family)